jgi:hypothetical protein
MYVSLDGNRPVILTVSHLEYNDMPLKKMEHCGCLYHMCSTPFQQCVADFFPIITYEP